MYTTTEKLIKALSKVRKDLIGLFASHKVRHPEHYDISAADASKEFTIKFSNKQKQFSKKVLTAVQFNCKGKCKVTKQHGNEIRIAILDSYIEQFLSTEEVKDAQNTENKGQSGPGRPKEEFGLFIQKLVEFVEMKSGIKHKANPGFYITSEGGTSQKRIAVINCGEKYITNKIVLGIEMDSYYLARVENIDDKHIHITMNEQSPEMTKIRKNMELLLGVIEKEARDYAEYFILQRETSIFFACKENPIEIAYFFENDTQARIFSEAINDSCKVKKDGKQVRLFFEEEKIEELLKKESFLALPRKQVGLITKVSANSDVQETYVHTSFDYDEFRLLAFNRDIIKSHVTEIAESMNKHGVLSFVTVIITDCIDGVFRKWVVDGQHRLRAFELRQSPVLYTVTRANSKKEIVRLIADLNQTSRRWAIRNFLHAWHSLDIPDYTILKELLEKTKLPFSFLLEVLSESDRSKASRDFQNGDFEVVNEERSRRHVDYIMSLRLFLPRSSTIYSAFVHYFRKREEEGRYDNELMKMRMKDYGEQIMFAAGESKEGLIRKIDTIYTGELLMSA